MFINNIIFFNIKQLLKRKIIRFLYFHGKNCQRLKSQNKQSAFMNELRIMDYKMQQKK